MANAPVVVRNATSATPRVGNVLEGLTFFVVQRVPRRTGLLKDIEANGGRITRHEKDCDYVIADHLRRDAPGGSYSYTLIESAIKHGALPDPADHATGGQDRSDRAVGSGVPGKSTRTPFTAEDDKVLWEWVEEKKQDGGAEKGNDIYKELEKHNKRHTYQAWRDRYIRKLMDKPPPAGTKAPAASMVQPSVQETEDESVRRKLANTRPASVHTRTGEPEEPVAKQSPKEEPVPEQLSEEINGIAEDESNAEEPTEDEWNALLPNVKDIDEKDFKLLFVNAVDIESVPGELLEDAWSAFAQANEGYSADDWDLLYNTFVLPAYREWLSLKPRRNHNNKQAALSNGAQANQNALIDVQTDNLGTQMPGSSNAKRKRQEPQSAADGSPEVHKRPRTSPPRSRQGDGASALPKRSLKTEPIVLVDHDASSSSDIESQQDGKRNTASVRRIQQDGARGRAISEDAAPTSELNREVDVQLHQETRAASSTIRDLGPQSIESVPTSEANMAADLQLRIEAVAKQVRFENGESARTGAFTADARNVAREQSEKQHQEGNAIEDGPEDVGEVVAADKNDTAEDGDQPPEESETHDSQHALTAANLASQDDQHRTHVSRARDLPEDDDMQDQSDFVNYLQNTLQAGEEGEGRPATATNRDRTNDVHNIRPLSRSSYTQDIARAQAELSAQVSDLPQTIQRYKNSDNIYIAQLLRREQEQSSLSKSEPAESPMAVFSHSRADLTSEPVHEDEDVLMSSQQELDEVLEDNFKWPQSPEQKRGGQELQSQEFSTQIPYATSNATGLAAPDFQLSSQSVMSQADDHRRNGRIEEENEEDEDEDEDNEDHDSDDDDDDARTASRHNMYDANDGDEEAEDGRDGDYDEDNTIQQDAFSDEPDLAVAEPDGGFPEDEVPSSEADDEFEDAAEAHNTQPDIITISSRASSSSPYQSPEPESLPWQHGPGLTRSMSKALETQDIVDAETQIPDLTAPIPPASNSDSNDDEDETSTHHRLPEQDHQSLVRQEHQQSMELVEDEEDEDADEDEDEDDAAELQSWMARMKAKDFTDASIKRALQRTSFRTTFAQYVLLHEKRGHGLPDDVKEVWTEREDRALEGTDAIKIKLLVAKHGDAECDHRLQYLAEWRELAQG